MKEVSMVTTEGALFSPVQGSLKPISAADSLDHELTRLLKPSDGFLIERCRSRAWSELLRLGLKGAPSRAITLLPSLASNYTLISSDAGAKEKEEKEDFTTIVMQCNLFSHYNSSARLTDLPRTLNSRMEASLPLYLLYRTVTVKAPWEVCTLGKWKRLMYKVCKLQMVPYPL